MKAEIISFSENGSRLAIKLAEEMGKLQWDVSLWAKSIYAEAEQTTQVKTSLQEWTGEHWTRNALIFVGALGIAVRACAPFIKDKKTDPAVICLDEKGKFCIPLLSGHIGGANELVAQIAEKIDAIPVITTATDLNDCFAVDLFAKENQMTIRDMSQAKEISAALLAGEKIIALGIGCRKGVPMEIIEAAVQEACKKSQVPFHCIGKAASIDLKKDEPGILGFAEKYQIPFETYSAEELNQVAGSYTTSFFVESVTGVDNVCERSAVKASGQGILIQRKVAANQVTVALAVSVAKLT